MSAHCRPDPVSHSYFVVMIDYGRRGREAIVDPEMTRRGVVERIRSREFDRIAFIHKVEDGLVDDVTNELLKEAGFYVNKPTDPIMERFDALIDLVTRDMADA